MKLAVIGAAGQVGQEFTKCLETDTFVPLTRDQVNMVDQASVDACIDRIDCDVIVTLAAFHDVNGCEDDIEKAFQVVADAGQADQARQVGDAEVAPKPAGGSMIEAATASATFYIDPYEAAVTTDGRGPPGPVLRQGPRKVW